jgi:hypothetical protein
LQITAKTRNGNNKSEKRKQQRQSSRRAGKPGKEKRRRYEKSRKHITNQYALCRSPFKGNIEKAEYETEKGKSEAPICGNGTSIGLEKV